MPGNATIHQIELVQAHSNAAMHVADRSLTDGIPLIHQIPGDVRIARGTPDSSKFCKLLGGHGCL